MEPQVIMKGRLTPQAPIAMTSLLILILAAMSPAKSLETVAGVRVADTLQTSEGSRRTFLRSAFSTASLVGISMAAPDPAKSVQPRNEALCGTGFFTNIAQYYCTDIGNISDEGSSKDISKEEETSLNSLMGKLDLDLNQVGKEGASKNDATVEMLGGGDVGSVDAKGKEGTGRRK